MSRRFRLEMHPPAPGVPVPRPVGTPLIRYSALVADPSGVIRMQHRSNSDICSLSGGVTEIGETLENVLFRETKGNFNVTYSGEVSRLRRSNERPPEKRKVAGSIPALATQSP